MSASTRYVWERCCPEPNSGCWLWLGSLGSHGYGNAYWDNRADVAHRVSWRAFCGGIPGRAWVLHKCDIKSCVNPDHLYLGDHKQNMDDVARRKYHPNRRLSDDQAVAVKEALSRGIPQRLIARIAGVEQGAVLAISAGRSHRYAGK